MKIYTFPIAPNPTRVRTYMREKGITDIEEVLVDLSKGEHQSAEHLSRNEAGTLPVLELDDGTFLTESLTIMNYLETRYPEPPMLGTTPETSAQTAQAERTIEMNILLRIVRLVHAANSPLGLPANPPIADYERERLPTHLERLDRRLADKNFVMGDTVSIADCTLFAGLQFAEFASLPVYEDYPNLNRWYSTFKQRPSAQL